MLTEVLLSVIPVNSIRDNDCTLKPVAKARSVTNFNVSFSRVSCSSGYQPCSTSKTLSGFHVEQYFGTVGRSLYTPLKNLVELAL